jgi:hypothetical protein
LLIVSIVQATSMIDDNTLMNFQSNGVYKMMTFWFNSFFALISHDESYLYKEKHRRSTPVVSSLETRVKNNFILATAIGITHGCYALAFIPLALTNDAGSFFTDCLTMWTMYTYFFEDAKQIDY